VFIPGIQNKLAHLLMPRPLPLISTVRWRVWTEPASPRRGHDKRAVAPLFYRAAADATNLAQRSATARGLVWLARAGGGHFFWLDRGD